jgi:hypothetical protein
MKQISIVKKDTCREILPWGSIALLASRVAIERLEELPLAYVMLTNVHTAQDIVQPLGVFLEASAFAELNWEVVALQIGEAIQKLVSEHTLGDVVYEIRAPHGSTKGCSQTMLTNEARLEAVGKNVIVQYRNRHSGFYQAVNNEPLMHSGISAHGNVINMHLAVGAGITFQTYNEKEQARAVESAVGGFYGTCRFDGVLKHFSLTQEMQYGSAAVPLNEYVFSDNFLVPLIKNAVGAAFPFLDALHNPLTKISFEGVGATMTDCALRGRSF